MQEHRFNNARRKTAGNDTQAQKRLKIFPLHRELLKNKEFVLTTVTTSETVERCCNVYINGYISINGVLKGPER